MSVRTALQRLGADIARETRLITGVTIFSGDSLASGHFDLGGHTKLMIFTPSGIAGSQFSFQARPSLDADVAFSQFLDLYNGLGGQVFVEYAANRAIMLDLAGTHAGLVAARFLRIRSGPTASGNAQIANMRVHFITKG